MENSSQVMSLYSPGGSTLQLGVRRVCCAGQHCYCLLLVVPGCIHVVCLQRADMPNVHQGCAEQIFLLELEIVRNKKKLLQDDRRERRPKVVYIPYYYEDENLVFFKPTNDLLAVTSSLRLFHSFTTLLLKEYFEMSSRTLFSDFSNWILI